jgi:hypothetical protein
VCVCRVGVSTYMSRYYSCTQMRGVRKKRLAAVQSVSLHILNTSDPLSCVD